MLSNFAILFKCFSVLQERSSDNHTDDDLLDEADSINGFHKSIHNRLQYLIRLHKTMNSVVYRREIINPHRKDICHYITNIVIIQ